MVTQVAIPIGSICEVRVLASQMGSRADIEVFRGNLIAITPDWVILKDGSFENWLPLDKVVSMRVSK